MKSEHLAPLLSELWAMEPIALERLFTTLFHVKTEGPPKAQPVDPVGYEIDVNGTARIPIKGVMLKEVPGWFGFFGIQATGTKSAKEAVERAAADDNAKAIVLDIDSPGGSVAGTEELAQAVYDARQVKSTSARVSDQIASAAYWVGSQTDWIDANRGAFVGSIGVYGVIYDSSKAAEDQGVKVHVVRSGENKGIGVPGDQVTDKQLESQQRLIDSMADLFIGDVARGRKMERKAVAKLATGDVWLAEEAKNKGLIDTVGAKGAPAVEDDNPEPTGPEKGKATMPEEREGMGAVGLEELQAKLEEVSKIAEEAREQAAQATARAEKAEAELLDAKKAQCADIVQDGIANGRITPPMLEGVERFVESMAYNAEVVKTFVEGLPPQTNPQKASDTPINDEPKPAPKVNEDVAAVMAFLGNTEEDIEQWGDAWKQFESEVVQ